MSAFKEYREELEQYEQMFGKERGRLAVSLDRMTNALVLVGQHGVYCTSQRNPTLASDGYTGDRAGIDAREGAGAIGDGRVEEGAGGGTGRGGGWGLKLQATRRNRRFHRG